jgi:hypothetical protein
MEELDSCMTYITDAGLLAESITRLEKLQLSNAR